MKIYVASSWRNKYQQDVVRILQAAHFDVYDFRHPNENSSGFGWSEIDPEWKNWTVVQYRDALDSFIAYKGFKADQEGLDTSDACILVLPCGKSAHLEAGYMIGRGKPTLFYSPEPTTEPELMYKLGNGIAISTREVLDWAIYIDKKRTCHYAGCLLPYTNKPPCALCYEYRCYE